MDANPNSQPAGAPRWQPQAPSADNVLDPRIMAWDPTNSYFSSGWQYTSEDKQLVLTPDVKFFDHAMQPINAMAVFTRAAGWNPRRFRVQDRPAPSTKVWSEQEIQEKATYYTSLWQAKPEAGLFMLTIPFRWEDLFYFFDLHDIYSMGAWNAWRVVMRVVNMQRVVTGVFDRARSWVANWLMWPQNQNALRRWDTRSDILTIIDEKDWVSGGLKQCSNLDLVEIRRELHWYRGLSVSKFNDNGFMPIDDGRPRTNAALKEESVFAWIYRTEHYDTWLPTNVATWRSSPSPTTDEDSMKKQDKLSADTAAMRESKTTPSSPTQESIMLAKAASTPVSPTVERAETVPLPSAESVDSKPLQIRDSGSMDINEDQEAPYPPVVCSSRDKNGSYLWTPQRAREEYVAQVAPIPALEITGPTSIQTYPLPAEYLQSRRGYGTMYSPEDFKQPDYTMQWPSLIHKTHVEHLRADYHHFAQVYAGYSEPENNEVSAVEQRPVQTTEARHHSRPVQSSATTSAQPAVFPGVAMPTPSFAPAVQSAQAHSSVAPAIPQSSTFSHQVPVAGAAKLPPPTPDRALADRHVVTGPGADSAKDHVKKKGANRKNSVRTRKDGSEGSDGRPHWTTKGHVDDLHGPTVRYEPPRRPGSFGAQSQPQQQPQCRFQQRHFPAERPESLGHAACINQPLVDENGLHIKYLPCPCQKCEEVSRSIHIALVYLNDITERQAQKLLIDFFSEIGEVEFVALKDLPKTAKPNPNLRRAFLRFKNEASAIRAVQERPEFNLPALNKRVIRVSFPYFSRHFTPLTGRDRANSGMMPPPPPTSWRRSSVTTEGSLINTPIRQRALSRHSSVFAEAGSTTPTSSLGASAMHRQQHNTTTAGHPGSMHTPARGTGQSMYTENRTPHDNIPMASGQFNSLSHQQQMPPMLQQTTLYQPAYHQNPATNHVMLTEQNQVKPLLHYPVAQSAPNMSLYHSHNAPFGHQLPVSGFPPPVHQLPGQMAHGPLQPQPWGPPPPAVQHVIERHVNQGMASELSQPSPLVQDPAIVAQRPAMTSAGPQISQPGIGDANAVRPNIIAENNNAIIGSVARGEPVMLEHLPGQQAQQQVTSQPAADPQPQSRPVAVAETVSLPPIDTAQESKLQSEVGQTAELPGKPVMTESVQHEKNAAKQSEDDYGEIGTVIRRKPVAKPPRLPSAWMQSQVSSTDTEREASKKEESKPSSSESMAPVSGEKQCLDASTPVDGNQEIPAAQEQTVQLKKKNPKGKSKNNLNAVGPPDPATDQQFSPDAGLAGTTQASTPDQGDASAPKKKQQKRKKTTKKKHPQQEQAVEDSTASMDKASRQPNTPHEDGEPAGGPSSDDMHPACPALLAECGGVRGDNELNINKTRQKDNKMQIDTKAAQKYFNKTSAEDSAKPASPKGTSATHQKNESTNPSTDSSPFKDQKNEIEKAKTKLNKLPTKTPSSTLRPRMSSSDLVANPNGNFTHFPPNFHPFPRIVTPGVARPASASVDFTKKTANGQERFDEKEKRFLEEPPLTAATTHSRVSSSGYYTAHSELSSQDPSPPSSAQPAPVKFNTPPSEERHKKEKAEAREREPLGSPTPKGRKSKGRGVDTTHPQPKTALSKLNPHAKVFSSPAPSPQADSFPEQSAVSSSAASSTSEGTVLPLEMNEPRQPARAAQGTSGPSKESGHAKAGPTDSAPAASGAEGPGRSHTYSPQGSPNSGSDCSKTKSSLRGGSDTPSPTSKVVTWQEKVETRTPVRVHDGTDAYVDGQEKMEKRPLEAPVAPKMTDDSPAASKTVATDTAQAI